MTTDTEDTTYLILKHGYCRGHSCSGKGIPQEDHICPYAEEIDNDFTPCNCCEECEHQCAMDI